VTNDKRQALTLGGKEIFFENLGLESTGSEKEIFKKYKNG